MCIISLYFELFANSISTKCGFKEYKSFDILCLCSNFFCFPFRKYNSNLSASSLESGFFEEPFLTDLGATSIESLDYSDFEGAYLIHNLNEPLLQNPLLEKSRGKYNLVLDFGTSEYVFQPAQSI